MKINFLHLRNSVYFRGKFQEFDCKGGATVAYTFGLVNYGNTCEDRVIIRGAVAICDSQDSYVKAKGRINATDILVSNQPSSRVFFIDLGPKSELAFKASSDGVFDVLHETVRLRTLITEKAVEVVMDSYRSMYSHVRSKQGSGCMSSNFSTVKLK